VAGAGLLGILAVGGGVLALVFAGVGAQGTSTPVTLSDADRKANLAALEAKILPLKAVGCTRGVVTPVANTNATTVTLNMHADGNCARLVMASISPGALLEVSAKPPVGAAIPGRSKGALELELCPTETGDHVLSLSGPATGYAHAVVDCPPAREKFANDPEKNGSATVSARLKALTAAGCSKVLLAPDRFSGPQSLTSSMDVGRFCAVLVAATGVDGARLGLHVASPIGETLADAKPAPVVESVLCAKMAGPHKIELKPTTLYYFTLAGIDCPRKVAERLARAGN
jgi:hypothetical protein